MRSTREFISQFAKGFIKINAPSVAQGAVSKAFENINVTVEDATQAVQGNLRLWPLIPEHYHNGIFNLIDVFGGLDWLTAEWLIESVRNAGTKDAKALASLFLGWRKARNYLGRQIEDCKREIEQLKPR